MYRPFGDMTSKILEEGNYFAPNASPEQIFKRDSRAGRSEIRSVLTAELAFGVIGLLIYLILSLVN